MTDYVSPTEQATNLIRHIGNEVKKTGHPIPQLSGISGIIGAQSDALADKLIEDLELQGLIMMDNDISTFDGHVFTNVTLTMDGWKQFEKAQNGERASGYGFLAMEFNDPEHDAFVSGVLKPAVKDMAGYELHDLRDKSRAGVIDNILRKAIRDAQFMIVDLTHDNRGAYWEAGYAEGLGKPVVYICEKVKFDEASTHFDTNHLTTVLWSRDEGEAFCEELVATLLRSLEPPELAV